MAPAGIGSAQRNYDGKLTGPAFNQPYQNPYPERHAGSGDLLRTAKPGIMPPTPAEATGTNNANPAKKTKNNTSLPASLVLCFSTMLLFITHSSFIYQEWFGLSNGMFAILFASNIAVMAILNLINRPLLRRFSSVVLLRVQVATPCCRSRPAYWHALPEP